MKIHRNSMIFLSMFLELPTMHLYCVSDNILTENENPPHFLLHNFILQRLPKGM